MVDFAFLPAFDFDFCFGAGMLWGEGVGAAVAAVSGVVALAWLCDLLPKPKRDFFSGVAATATAPAAPTAAAAATAGAGPAWLVGSLLLPKLLKGDFFSGDEAATAGGGGGGRALLLLKLNGDFFSGELAATAGGAGGGSGMASASMPSSVALDRKPNMDRLCWGGSAAGAAGAGAAGFDRKPNMDRAPLGASFFGGSGAAGGASPPLFLRLNFIRLMSNKCRPLSIWRREGVQGALFIDLFSQDCVGFVALTSFPLLLSKRAAFFASRSPCVWLFVARSAPMAHLWEELLSRRLSSTLKAFVYFVLFLILPMSMSITCMHKTKGRRQKSESAKPRTKGGRAGGAEVIAMFQVYRGAPNRRLAVPRSIEE